MSMLPDVIQLGSFPIDIRTVMGVLGLALAYFVARPRGRDLVLDLALGGILGAKLVDVALNPAGYLANPATLLIFPFGPLALPAGLLGGASVAAWSLRRRPDRLEVLDEAAVPLAFGLALAAVGFRGPGAWAFAALLWAAAIGAAATARRLAKPGHRAASAAIMIACALALADLASPGPAISRLQIAAAVAGTLAWLWARRG